jgi:hypothetical protein
MICYFPIVIHQELKTRINTIFLSHNYLSYLVNNLKEILDYYEMKKIHNIQLPIISSDLWNPYSRYIMPPETSVTNSTPASSFALATTALSHRLSMP